MKNIQDAYSYLDGYSSSHCYMESVPEAVNRQEYRNESHLELLSFYMQNVSSLPLFILHLPYAASLNPLTKLYFSR